MNVVASPRHYVPLIALVMTACFSDAGLYGDDDATTSSTTGGETGGVSADPGSDSTPDPTAGSGDGAATTSSDPPPPSPTTGRNDDGSGGGTVDESTSGGSSSSTGEPTDPARVVFLLPYAGAPMNFGGIAGADAQCQAAAEAAGLSGEYAAWLSAIPSNSPDARFSHEGGPFVRPDGITIAADWADLTDGEIAAPILVTADGYEYSPTAQPETTVITHTTPTGTHAGGVTPCSGYLSDSVIEPTSAQAGEIGAAWTDAGDGWGCTNDVLGGPSLYCFQQ